MHWDILLSLAAFLAVVVAVRGDTWDSGKKRFWQRITMTGWYALLIGLATVSLSVLKSYHAATSQRQRQVEAATQVLADLAPQATFYRALVLKPDLTFADLTDLQDELAQFSDYLEAKLNRHSRHLAAETASAGEDALTAQRQLQIMLARQKDGGFTDDELRQKVRRCFVTAKDLGDALLLVMGNKVGMDGTYILRLASEDEGMSGKQP